MNTQTVNNRMQDSRDTDMRRRKMIPILACITLLLGCLPMVTGCAGSGKPAVGGGGQEKPVDPLPEYVRNLQLPSGIDNEYLIAVKENQAAGQVRPIIRIAPFETTSEFDRAIEGRGIDVGEMLKGKLSDTGRFTLLGGDEDLEAIMEEQKKALSGLFSGDIEFGNLKLAGYTLSGKLTRSNPAVTQVGGYFELKVQVGFALSMVNNTTGEVVHTKNIVADAVEQLFVSAEGMIIRGPRNLTDKPLNAINSTGTDIDLVPQYLNALDAAMSETVFFLQEQYPAIGELIQIDGKRVVTSLSQLSGIKTGDYLLIVRLGEPLTNSGGTILGYDKQVIGACKVTTVESNMSQAEMVPLPNPATVPEKFDIVVSVPTRHSRYGSPDSP